MNPAGRPSRVTIPRVGYRTWLSIFFALLLSALPIFPADAQTGGICNRTVQVQTELLKKFNPVPHCSAVTATHLARVTVLSLQSKGITALKAVDLAGLTGLTTLDLSQNRLTSLPNLSHLTQLKSLYVQDNDLTSLPDLSRNIQLVVIELTDNELTSLPDLSQHRKIDVYNYFGNPLSNLSDLTLTGSDGNTISLIETFDGNTKTEYTAVTASAVTSVTVTPTAADTGVMPPVPGHSSVRAPTINVGLKGGELSAVDTGSASGAISLVTGDNSVVIQVYGRNIRSVADIRTYTVKVRRPPTVTLALSDTSISENSESTTVTATLSSAMSTALTVTISARAVSPAVSGDFSLSTNKVLTIAANETSSTGTVTITGVNNNVDAPNKTVTVSGTANGGGVSNPVGQTLTITDDDDAPTGITLKASPDSVTENGGAKTVTVTASVNGSTRYADAKTVTVTVGKSGDSATEGDDYSTVGTLSIPIAAGAASGSKSFTLTPTNDVIDEANETISVEGTSTGVTVTAGQITITDDDAAPSGAIFLQARPLGVFESDDSTTVTVTATLPGTTTRRAATEVTIKVGEKGTATEGTDYATVADFTLTIAAGKRSGTAKFRIDPTQDVTPENPVERVIITGSTTAPNLTVGETEMYIFDDDGEIILRASPSSVAESDGSTEVTLEARLKTFATRKADTEMTIKVGKNGDSATEGTDYATVADFTLTITAGQQSGTATFDIDPTQDASDEGAGETVGITGEITSVSPGLTVGETSMTITDDDEKGIVLSETAVTVTEASGAGRTASYTVKLASQPTADVTVAVASGDTSLVTVNKASLSFTTTNWNQPQTVTVTGMDDAIDNPQDRTATVSHSASGDYGSVSKDLTVTVADDEVTGVTLSANPDSVTENGGAKTVTVTASVNGSIRYADAKTVAVTVGNSGDSATEGTDYTTVGSLSIEIAAGAASGSTSFTLTPTNDAIDEGAAETISMAGTSSVPVTAGQITITDDDTRGIVLSTPAVTVTEAGNTAEYTVKLASKPTTNTVRVYPVSGDVNVARVSRTILVFNQSNWNSPQTVTVTGMDDRIVNAADRTVNIIHLPGGNYPSANVNLTVTVVDDEQTGITLTASPDSVTENGGVKTVTVTASVNGSIRYADAKTVAVTVGKSGDSAAEGTDYATVADLSIEIAADAASGSKSFTLTPTNDALDESNETISVEGTSSVPVTADRIIIADDDTRGIVLSKTAVTVNEASGTGNSAEYTVKLASQPTGPVTVAVTSGDTGVATVNKASLNFSTTNWNIAQTVTVTGKDDSIDNMSDRTATVSHSASGGDYGSESKDLTVTVADDEATGITLVVSPDSVTENGGAKTVKLTASVNGSTRYAEAKTVTVAVGNSADSATEGTDYATVTDFSIQISAYASSVSRNFTLTPTNDAIDEGTGESISVTGTSPGLTVTADQITITDDDTRGVALSREELTLTEGGAHATYTLKLLSQPTEEVTINVSGDPAGLVNLQYQSTSSSSAPIPVTFDANDWNQAKTITVTPKSDDDHEDSSVSIVHTVEGYGDFTAADSISVTVTDTSVPAVLFSLTQVSLNEGETATYTVKLATRPSGAVTVTPKSADTGVATVSGPLLLNSTNWSNGLTVTVTAVQDENGATDTVSVSHTVAGYHDDVTRARSVSVTVADDDAAVILSDSLNTLITKDTNLFVWEGLPVTPHQKYKVRLAAQPGGTVTVTPVSQDKTRVSVSEPLTFDKNNWATDQIVELKGLFDDDGINQRVKINHTVSGYDAQPGSVNAIVRDYHGNTLIVEPRSLAIHEGKTGTYSVKLRTDPKRMVTVTPGVANDSAASVSGALTFDTTNWSIPQNVTVTAKEDEDRGRKHVTITNEVSGYPGYTKTHPGGWYRWGNDNPDVSVVALSTADVRPGLALFRGWMYIDEGSTITSPVVRLATEPLNTVTVSLRSSDESIAKVSPATLEFTVDNWNVYQNITVTGVEDDIIKQLRRTEIVFTTTGDYADSEGDMDVIVRDNDGIALSVTPASVDESDGATTVEVEATLPGDGSLDKDTTITIKVGDSGDAATEGTDYATVADFTLSIPKRANSATGSFNMVPTQDAIDEGDGETLSISGTTTTSGLSVSSTQMTITDDDATPTLTLALSNSSISENGGETTVTAELSGASSEEVTVTVSAAAVSPAVSGDFTLSQNKTLTIAAGSKTSAGTVTINAVDNSVDAAAKQVTVSGAASGGHGVADPASKTLTITDDDGEIALTASLSSVAESADATEVTVTATLPDSLTRSSATAVTVKVGEKGTATEGTDYATVTDFTLTIAAGQSSGTAKFSINPTQDAIDEPNETVGITGATSVLGLTVGETSIFIADDDAPPSGDIALAASPASVAESADATEVTVTATLPGSTTRSSATAVTVKVGEKGTATEGTDYATVNDFTLTIAAGQRSGTATFNIDPTQDVIDEGDGETVGITGATSVSGLTVGETSLTINDDDAVPSGAISLAASPASVDESADATEVTVSATLPGSTTRNTATEVTVKVGEKGTATEGTDYATVTDFTLTIAAGQRSGSATFDIDPTQDAIDEGDGETVGITGTTSVSGLTVGETSLTINDDDAAPSGAISLAASPASVAESDDATEVTVTATLPGSTTRNAATAVTVKVGEKGTATEGTDYATVADFTLTIAAGQQSGTAKFNIDPTQDVIDEGDDETVGITGTTSVSGFTVGETSITITDDDAAPSGAISLAANPAGVLESADATEGNGDGDAAGQHGPQRGHRGDGQGGRERHCDGGDRLCDRGRFHVDDCGRAAQRHCQVQY